MRGLGCHLSRVFSSGAIQIETLDVLATLAVTMIALLRASVRGVRVFSNRAACAITSLGQGVTSILDSVGLGSSGCTVLEAGAATGAASIRVACNFPIRVARNRGARAVGFFNNAITSTLGRTNLAISRRSFIRPTLSARVCSAVCVSCASVNCRDNARARAVPCAAGDRCANAVGGNAIGIARGNTGKVGLMGCARGAMGNMPALGRVASAAVLARPMGTVRLINAGALPSGPGG